MLYTVFETPQFAEMADKLLTEDERLDFITHIAQHPDEGTVIPHSEGIRKVRWPYRGKGKSGGLRFLYYKVDLKGEIWLIYVHTKKKTAMISTQAIRKALK